MRKLSLLAILVITVIGSAISHKVSFKLRQFYGYTFDIYYGISLLDCARQCYNTDGCTNLNYQRKTLLCKLIDISSGGDDEEEIVVGSVQVSDMLDILESTVTGQDMLIPKTPKRCPHLPAVEGVRLLGNLRNPGARRTITCEDAFRFQDGLNTTVCMDDGVWSDYGTCVRLSTIYETCVTDIECIDTDSECRNGLCRCKSGMSHDSNNNTCVKSSTIRETCVASNDCIDTDSECRNGVCWCKPGLSHDSDRSTCVSTCQGSYGDTFQVLDGFSIHNKDQQVYINYSNGSYIQDCMDLCLNHVEPNYICKSADATRNVCYLNNNQVSPLSDLTSFPPSSFLQRDCARSSTILEACVDDTECIDTDSECRNGLCHCKPGMLHDPTIDTCVKSSTIRETCVTNSDCIDTDSECRNDKCWCKPGLSHDPVSNTCVERCPGPYGDTFQILDDHSIYGHNVHVYTQYSNGSYDSYIRDCMDLCLNYFASNYTCINADSTQAKCFINDAQVAPLSYLTSLEGCSFLQRDCAFNTD